MRRERDSVKALILFSSALEAGTGLGLMVDPALVVKLLLHVQATDIDILIGRCFGVALLALAAACWPKGQHFDNRASSVLGLSIYNPLVAAVLAYHAWTAAGPNVLLWSVVALHAVIGILLPWAGRTESRVKGAAN